MVKSMKAQQDMVKMLFKQGGRVPIPVYDEYDYGNSILVSLDGVSVINIPKEEFYLDISKLKQVNLKYTLDLKLESKVGILTDTQKVFPERKKTAQLLTDDTGNIRVWFDIGLLKYFDHITSYHISKYNNPIFLYDEDTFMGLILPIRVNEGD